MSAAVTVTPGKRFADDAEPLALADLNAAGSPIMLLAVDSIGAPELITQDVKDIISEGLIGIRVDYIFPADKVVPFVGLNLELVTIDVPEARLGDPVYVTQIPGLSLELNADCNDLSVSLRGYAVDVAGVTILSGTKVTIIVFTARRVLPPGSAGGPPDPTGTTGYLTVTPGYVWADGEALATAKLDATCQPTAAVAAASVGRRELSAPDVQAIAAPTVGGLTFSGKVPVPITILPHNFSFFTITVTGAAVGQVPVLHGGPLLWRGRVSAANTVVIILQNVTNVTQTLAKGTVFRGTLL